MTKEEEKTGLMEKAYVRVTKVPCAPLMVVRCTEKTGGVAIFAGIQHC